jgi:hypothetical protein
VLQLLDFDLQQLQTHPLEQTKGQHAVQFHPLPLCTQR